MNSSTIIDKKNSFAGIILDIFTAALLALTFIPQLRIFSFYNYLQLFVGSSWFVVAFISNHSFFLSRNGYFWKSTLCILIMILIPFLFSNQTMVNRAANIAVVFIYYWIYNYNSTYRGITSNLRVIIISLPMILYTTINTIRELLVNPYASRSIKTTVNETGDLALSGIGGYGLVYSVVIIVFILIPIIFERKKLGINFWGVSVIIGLIMLFIYLVILSNFFTALLLVMAGVVSMILLYRSKSMLFLIVPFTLAYLPLQKDINMAVIDTICDFSQENGKTYLRLQEIKSEILLGGNTESVDSRSDVTKTTIDLFSEYPILGYIAGAGEEFNLQRVGQHSTVLDAFAMYGIFIGSFFLWVMWLPFKYCLSRRISYRMNVFSWIVGGSFIVLITANNITPSIGYAAFFVFPTIFDYINKKIYEQK